MYVSVILHTGLLRTASHTISGCKHHKTVTDTCQLITTTPIRVLWGTGIWQLFGTPFPHGFTTLRIEHRALTRNPTSLTYPLWSASTSCEGKNKLLHCVHVVIGKTNENCSLYFLTNKSLEKNISKNQQLLNNHQRSKKQLISTA